MKAFPPRSGESSCHHTRVQTGNCSSLSETPVEDRRQGPFDPIKGTLTTTMFDRSHTVAWGEEKSNRIGLFPTGVETASGWFRSLGLSLLVATIPSQRPLVTRFEARGGETMGDCLSAQLSLQFGCSMQHSLLLLMSAISTS